jgi:hypothetical protein
LTQCALPERAVSDPVVWLRVEGSSEMGCTPRLPRIGETCLDQCPVG